MIVPLEVRLSFGLLVGRSLNHLDLYHCVQTYFIKRLLVLIVCLKNELLLQGEDVLLVGDFTGNWKDPIKATHKGGSRYEVEIRLTQGK